MFGVYDVEDEKKGATQDHLLGTAVVNLHDYQRTAVSVKLNDKDGRESEAEIFLHPDPPTQPVSVDMLINCTSLQLKTDVVVVSYIKHTELAEYVFAGCSEESK
jgi:hypothetical protein